MTDGPDFTLTPSPADPQPVKVNECIGCGRQIVPWRYTCLDCLNADDTIEDCAP